MNLSVVTRLKSKTILYVGFAGFAYAFAPAVLAGIAVSLLMPLFSLADHWQLLYASLTFFYFTIATFSLMQQDLRRQFMNIQLNCSLSKATTYSATLIALLAVLCSVLPDFPIYLPPDLLHSFTWRFFFFFLDAVIVTAASSSFLLGYIWNKAARAFNAHQTAGIVFLFMFTSEAWPYLAEGSQNSWILLPLGLKVASFIYLRWRFGFAAGVVHQFSTEAVFGAWRFLNPF